MVMVLYVLPSRLSVRVPLVTVEGTIMLAPEGLDELDEEIFVLEEELPFLPEEDDIPFLGEAAVLRLWKHTNNYKNNYLFLFLLILI